MMDISFAVLVHPAKQMTVNMSNRLILFISIRFTVA